MKYEGKIYGKVGGKYIELEQEAAGALQAITYLLHLSPGGFPVYTAEWSRDTKRWGVWMDGGKIMKPESGEFGFYHRQIIEQFHSAQEAAECFYKHYPHLRPKV